MTDNDLEEQPPADYTPENHGAERPKRPRPKKFIVNASGHNGPPAKRKKKTAPAFVQPPIRIAPELIAEFAQRVRYVPKSMNYYARYAVANVIFKSPGAFDYPEEDLWNAIGRWNSSLRGISSIEGVTDRHHGWEHVQRLRAALARAANDPALQSKVKWKHNQFIAAVLLALDNGLESFFRNHPDGLMTPDEVAGMAPLPNVEGLQDHWLFKKPKSKPIPAGEAEPAPDFLPAPEEIAARRARGPQMPALFGGTKRAKAE